MLHKLARKAAHVGCNWFLAPSNEHKQYITQRTTVTWKVPYSPFPQAACYSGCSVGAWHAYHSLTELNLERSEVQVLGCPALKQFKLERHFIFPKPPLLSSAVDRILHWSDPTRNFCFQPLYPCCIWKHCKTPEGLTCSESHKHVKNINDIRAIIQEQP